MAIRNFRNIRIGDPAARSSPPVAAGSVAGRTFRNVRALAWAMRALLALWCLALAGAATAQDYPKFTGLVTDAANVIPDDREAALEKKLEALQQSTKRQLVVATVPSLGGGDVDSYANGLFRAWGIGLKGANNGVLLLVAPNEHQVRIEVGYGLEPWVTDALSGIVISRDITPRFKAGDLPGGIEAGVDALSTQLSLPQDEAQAKVAAAEAEFNKAHQRRAGGGGGGIPIGLIFWGVILLVVVVPMLGRRRGLGGGQSYGGGGSNLPIVLWGIANALGEERRGGGWGDGGGGGGFGGGSDGSWGGGGFTGGGGGSSGGGGASGSW